MKIEIVSGIIIIITIIAFCFVVVVAHIDKNTPYNKIAKEKTEPVKTEIPVQRIKCINQGERYCLEYQVFKEVNY